MWSSHVDHTAPFARPAPGVGRTAAQPSALLAGTAAGMWRGAVPGTLHAVPWEVLNPASRAPRRLADRGECRTSASESLSGRAPAVPHCETPPRGAPPTRANTGPTRASPRRDAHQPPASAQPAQAHSDLPGPVHPPRAPETHPLAHLSTPHQPHPHVRQFDHHPLAKPPHSRSTHPSSVLAPPPHPHSPDSCFRPGPALARPVVFCSTPRPCAPDLHIRAPSRERHPQHPSPRGRTASHQFLSESLTRLEALRTLCQQALT